VVSAPIVPAPGAFRYVPGLLPHVKSRAKGDSLPHVEPRAWD